MTQVCKRKKSTEAIDRIHSRILRFEAGDSCPHFASDSDLKPPNLAAADDMLIALPAVAGKVPDAMTRSGS